KRIATTLAAETYDTDWQHIAAIYDWVRENINYVEGKIKSAVQALKDKTGDCEEMTSLFVALCRASKIPARMVWVQGHCYPEFYMEDPEGQGVWFPCQAAGTRQFGRMEDYRLLLQKGDRFKIPGQRQPVRYVAENFSCTRKGSAAPAPIFIRQTKN
ncbi:MAG: transglutaminase-like domain-containing protein, partial [Planctomycetota bacterium]